MKLLPVIFRVWNKVDPPQDFLCDVLAIFPTVPSDEYGNSCMSYEHVGQHGSGSINLMVRQTRPATREESAPLRRELEKLGYAMSSFQKVIPNFHLIRRRAAEKMAAMGVTSVED